MNTIPAFNVHRNIRGELEARTDIELQPMGERTARVARVQTYKGARRGTVTCNVSVGIRESARASGFEGFTFALGLGGGGDYHSTLAGEQTRATEAAIARVHRAGLAALGGHLTAIRKAYGIPEPTPAEDLGRCDSERAASYGATFAEAGDDCIARAPSGVSFKAPTREEAAGLFCEHFNL